MPANQQRLNTTQPQLFFCHNATRSDPSNLTTSRNQKRSHLIIPFKHELSR
jgi:hypothetical protein